MASDKIRAQKQEVVSEIVSKLDNNDTAVIFEYQGLTVDQMAKLRKDLRDVNGEVKIYKNTLKLRSVADEKEVSSFRVRYCCRGHYSNLRCCNHQHNGKIASPRRVFGNAVPGCGPI